MTTAAVTPSSVPVVKSSSPTLSQRRSKELYAQFTWSETDEPHATRRQHILAAHPEVSKGECENTSSKCGRKQIDNDML